PKDDKDRSGPNQNGSRLRAPAVAERPGNCNCDTDREGDPAGDGAPHQGTGAADVPGTHSFDGSSGPSTASGCPRTEDGDDHSDDHGKRDRHWSQNNPACGETSDNAIESRIEDLDTPRTGEHTQRRAV